MIPTVVENIFDFLHQQRQVFQEYKLTGTDKRCTLILKFCHEDFLNCSTDTAVTETPLTEEITELTESAPVDACENQDPESDSGLQLSPNPVIRPPGPTRHLKKTDASQSGMVSEDTDASDNTDYDSDAGSDDSFDVVSVVDPDEPSDEKLAMEAVHELETSSTCHTLYLKAQVAGLSAKARENIMDQTRNTKILKRVYHFDGAMHTLTGVSEDVMVRLNIDSYNDSALASMRKWALRETSNKTGWQEWFEGELSENRYTTLAEDDRYHTASRKMEHILQNLMTKLREELR